MTAASHAEPLFNIQIDGWGELYINWELPLHAAASPTGSLAFVRDVTRCYLDFRGLSGDVFGVFPGQPDGVDFCGFWLVRAYWLKFGGDDDAAELGGHVGGGRLGLRGVPGGVAAAGLGVGGVVAGGGVPADGEGLA